MSCSGSENEGKIFFSLPFSGDFSWGVATTAGVRFGTSFFAGGDPLSSLMLPIGAVPFCSVNVRFSEMKNQENRKIVKMKNIFFPVWDLKQCRSGKFAATKLKFVLLKRNFYYPAFVWETIVNFHANKASSPACLFTSFKANCSERKNIVNRFYELRKSLI